MFISYIYLQVTNIHRLKCSSLDPFSTGHFLATAGDKVIKIWDYHMRMDLNFQVNIVFLPLLQCTRFSVCPCKSRAALVLAEYVGRPPCKVADLFHLSMEDIINSSRKEVGRKNGRPSAEHKYINIQPPNILETIVIKFFEACGQRLLI